jgi:hypothetical protein
LDVNVCRRLSSLKKPDVVVQVVVLAEDKRIQDLFKEQGFDINTCAEIAPIQVGPDIVVILKAKSDIFKPEAHSVSKDKT